MTCVAAFCTRPRNVNFQIQIYISSNRVNESLFDLNMTASTHATLHQTYSNAPIRGLPPRSDIPGDAQESRLIMTLSGRSHMLYTDDVTKAYSNQTPGATFIEAVSVDGTSSASYPRIQVHDPSDAHRLLRTHVQKPSFPYSTVLVGRGLIGQDDTDAWRKQRAWIKPAFQARHVHALFPIVLEQSVVCLQKLSERLRPTDNQCVDIHPLLLETTFVMIGHLMLGEHSDWIDTHGNELRNAFTQGLQPYYRTTPEGQRAAETMHRFTNESFARYHAESSERQHRVTLLSRLLADHSDSPYKNDPSLQHDELMTVMFAGHETTAHTLAWCLYELARHPQQQRRIRKAIQSQENELRRPTTQWSLREFQKVRLVTQAIRETLRLWPVVANGPFRELRSPETIKGRLKNHISSSEQQDYEDCALRAPTAFQVPHWTLHRHPALWDTKDDALAPPDEFDLDRPASASGWNTDAYMPFSRPPRDCLGRHVAMMEMQVLLIMLLQKYCIEWPESQSSKVGQNWATLVPEDGMLLRFQQIQEMSRL